MLVVIYVFCTCVLILQADTESRVQQCVTYFCRVCRRSFRWNVTNIVERGDVDHNDMLDWSEL